MAASSSTYRRRIDVVIVPGPQLHPVDIKPPHRVEYMHSIWVDSPELDVPGKFSPEDFFMKKHPIFEQLENTTYKRRVEYDNEEASVERHPKRPRKIEEYLGRGETKQNKGPGRPKKGGIKGLERPTAVVKEGPVRSKSVGRTEKRGPGRPKKVEKRGPGRPKKVEKRGPGRPKKVEKRGPGRPKVQKRGPGRPKVEKRGPGRPKKIERRGPGRPKKIEKRGPGRPKNTEKRGPGRPKETLNKRPGRPREVGKKVAGRPKKNEKRGPGRPKKIENKGPGRPKKTTLNKLEEIQVTRKQGKKRARSVSQETEIFSSKKIKMETSALCPRRKRPRNVSEEEHFISGKKIKVGTSAEDINKVIYHNLIINEDTLAQYLASLGEMVLSSSSFLLY
ncbi:neurofilament heavy polypeptide-like [Palaemon carinicauda]|uniref:neurofilament heavy polypeptide-like n=1 Tax=Palaemon carinicauda TaxID=392227 RepID=UPI0035B66720